MTRAVRLSRRRRVVRVVLLLAIAMASVVAAATVVSSRGANSRAATAPTGSSGTSSPGVSTTVTATTVAATTTTIAPLPAPYSRALQRENLRAGIDAWRITGRQKPGDIEGFADHVSAQRGDRIGIYVSTVAATFRIEAYRMGWYGGHVGHLVWRSHPIVGAVQAAATVADDDTNMVEAPWNVSAHLRITDAWFPGVYLLKLVGTDGQQSFVPLTVRDDSSHAAIIVNSSVTTWQAYNKWGGNNLYSGIGRHGGGGFDYRSRVVSFDRPYGFGDGAADFVGNELPFIVFAERLGLDLTYTTDVDLHERPKLLLHHRLFVSLGHDEYWSIAMREGVEAARDRGVSAIFLGANAVNRRVRFEDSTLGSNRHEVDYKDARDPIRKTDPAQVTVDWRQAPNARPESSLLGEQYECNPVRAAMVIAEPDHWIFTGTNLRRGDRLLTTVGTEYDHYRSSDPKPPGDVTVDVVTHSPVNCRGRESYADATVYVAPSGATVFDSGTNWWVSKLVFHCVDSERICVPDVVRRITANLLLRLGAGRHAPVPPTMPSSFPAPRP